ncbi:hypothetical protein P691DRAFT_725724 [Macrolepiota fuliginosa MF-IS2]|uniref:Uncharacterized protein n=1 Tax=Macrolepiota fuliginosa MF-IS2 TaxID=1400762 RepID=A0A9P5XHW7_9AGAR|nr:hypothetical protein P691DRAFT_725724 [Macrolepiota fuliginosa MF-IS2]
MGPSRENAIATLPSSVVHDDSDYTTDHRLLPRTDSQHGPCFECFVQDNDPRVRYDGQWSLNRAGFSTTHSTTSSGSTASLTFNGTGITVFGTVPTSNTSFNPPTVVYRVDAAQPFTTTQPVADRDVSNQPLFSFPLGSQGQEHKLTIQVLQAEAPFILEKFFVFPVNMTTPDPDLGPHTMPNSSASNATDSRMSLDDHDPSTLRALRTIRVLAGFLGVTLIILVVMSVFLVMQCVRNRRRLLSQKSALSRPGMDTYPGVNPPLIQSRDTLHTLHFHRYDFTQYASKCCLV